MGRVVRMSFYSGYSCWKTQCGTGGSREPLVPVKGVQAIRAIAIPLLQSMLMELLDDSTATEHAALLQALLQCIQHCSMTCMPR